MSSGDLVHQPYTPGAMVLANGYVWQVMEFLPGDMARLARPGKADCLVPVSRIAPVSSSAVLHPRLRPFSEYPEPKQLIALERHVQIQRCLLAGWTPGAIEKLAEEMGTSPKAAMRTMDKFFLGGKQLVLLIPGVGRYGVVHNKVTMRVRAIIEEAEGAIQLTEERPPEVAVLEYIETKCRREGEDPPARSTVRRYLKSKDEKEVITKREGPKAARDIFRSLQGRAPTGRHPFGKVEIDHSPINVLILLPSGKVVRAWITIAIDCYTRMILGVHIGIEAPSRLLVGMCMYRVMTSKRAWLESHGIADEWPCIGIPELIQTDSGVEFLSLDFERTALEKKIKIQNRPAGKADFGGFVERWMGQAAAIVEILPGKTFRNIVDKKQYNPKINASMSLEKLEGYFLHFIVEEYHHRSHKGLRGRSPISVWNRWHEAHAAEACLRATSVQPPNELLMSLLPSFQATIQQGGVRYNGIDYQDRCLDRWIARENPITGNRKHRFHRDPRWGNSIYWRTPDTGVWHRIGTKDWTTPDRSEWELEDLLKQDAAEGKKTENLEMIDKGRLARYAIQEDAKEKTAELQKERKKSKRKARKKGEVSQITLAPKSPTEHIHGLRSSSPAAPNGPGFEEEMWSDLSLMGSDLLD